MPAGAEAPVYAPFRAKLPPDTTAAIFWLKNRRKEQWQDSSSREITGANGGAIKSEIALDANTLEQIAQKANQLKGEF